METNEDVSRLAAKVEVDARGNLELPLSTKHSQSQPPNSPDNGVTIHEISADETITLRHQVLWPNYPISHVQLSEDDLGRHYGAFLPDSPEPVAVISVFAEPLPDGEQGPDNTSAARFRKFACRPDLQSRGIGTLLLQHVIRVARVDTLWCDARLATAAWYQKRGLVAFGPVFLKSGVEYVRMRTGLSSS